MAARGRAELADHLFPAAVGQRSGRQHALDALEQPGCFDRRSLTNRVVVSAYILDPDRRVLLVHHTRFKRWQQLGGHVEPGDLGLADAAAREAREESGLPDLRLVPGVLDVSVYPGGLEPRRWIHDVGFLFFTSRPEAVSRGPGEAPIRWFDSRGPLTLPPEVEGTVRRAIERANLLADGYHR